MRFSVKHVLIEASYDTSTHEKTVVIALLQDTSFSFWLDGSGGSGVVIYLCHSQPNTIPIGNPSQIHIGNMIPWMGTCL